jgi:hypothetical protein
MKPLDYLELVGGCAVLALLLAAAIIVAGVKRGVRKLDGLTRQLEPPARPAARAAAPQQSLLPRVCPLVIEPGHTAHVWTFMGYAYRCAGYRGDPDPTRSVRPRMPRPAHGWKEQPDTPNKRRHLRRDDEQGR